MICTAAWGERLLFVRAPGLGKALPLLENAKKEPVLEYLLDDIGWKNSGELQTECSDSVCGTWSYHGAFHASGNRACAQ